MKLAKSEHGVAHLALIVVVVVAVVAAGAGFLVFNKNKGPDNGKLKADASGAYSSICGSGYNARATKDGVGFKVYTFKNPSSGRGCAVMVNDNWGTSANMSIKVIKGIRDDYSATIASDSGNYKYYAGPVKYDHAVGLYFKATKNGKTIDWNIMNP